MIAATSDNQLVLDGRILERHDADTSKCRCVLFRLTRINVVFPTGLRSATITLVRRKSKEQGNRSMITKA